jgi:hypothetical protein
MNIFLKQPQAFKQTAIRVSGLGPCANGAFPPESRIGCGKAPMALRLHCFAVDISSAGKTMEQNNLFKKSGNA